LADLWERVLRFERDDDAEDKLTKLETALAPLSLPLQETVPLLAGLLSIPLPEERYPPLTWSPQLQRQKTMDAFLTALLESAEQQPVFLVFEDLHWADPSTLELLGLLLDQVPTARVFALLTCRPVFQPSWAIRAHMTHLTLSRLPRKQVEQLMINKAGGKRLPAEVLEQIAIETDGVPLFVEELTQAVVESGALREVNGHYELTGPLADLAIPTTLQDSLMARLDRLGEAKGVAQLAATLGRTFSYELLRAVSELSETTLQRELSFLVQAELLYQRRMPPRSTYVFKHALIQDAAYQSLLKSTRRQYHQSVAQVLEAQFPDTADAQPELLAHHLTEAREIARAVPYWRRAGQRAVEHSAYEEAVNHLTKGLELVERLPDTPERIRHKIVLQADLGNALMVTRGRAAPEVETAFRRARELCLQTEDAPEFFRVSWGLFWFYLLRGELQATRRLAEQLPRLAERDQSPELLLEAHHAMGTMSFYLGDLESAQEHVKQGMALYYAKKRPPNVFATVQDPGMACLCYASHMLVLMGYPDQARQKINEALALAETLAHPHTMALALNHATVFHQHRREVKAAQEKAEGAYRTRYEARVFTVGGVWNPDAGLGVGRARPVRGRNLAHATGHGQIAGPRGRDSAARPIG
jgi:tetratricopeptide (TPR) repeat protein